ncbi:MAG: hypothetical protein RBG13Loki_2589, partial [Promethearchaeota archaeon CR_4]
MIDGVDSAIITWQDNRSGNWDIYAQRVSNILSTAPTNLSVTINGGDLETITPNVALTLSAT